MDEKAKAVQMCGECDNGMVLVGGCTCGSGGGASPFHEPHCGYEPCPKGCSTICPVTGAGEVAAR